MAVNPDPVEPGGAGSPAPAFLSTAPPRMRAGVDALPTIVLALTFAFYAVHPRLKAGTLAFLASVLQTQFLVIHSSAYLLLLLTIRSRTWKGAAVRIAGLVLFGSLYVAFLLQFGTQWAIEFAVLTVMTWFGPLTRLRNSDAAPELLIRWVVSLAAFMLATGVTGMPSGVDTWPTCTRTPWAGLLYYGALSAVEFTEVYPAGTRFFRGVFAFLGDLLRSDPGAHKKG